MSRLSIEIEAEQHRQIKTLATFEGMSMKDFILSKILTEKAPGTDATEELLSSPKNAKRLRKALATPKDQYLRFENLEDLKDALGI